MDVRNRHPACTSELAVVADRLPQKIVGDAEAIAAYGPSV